MKPSLPKKAAIIPLARCIKFRLPGLYHFTSADDMDLLTGNQVQLGIAEHSLDPQAVQLIISLPRTLARLHVGQVMTLKEFREGQDRLACFFGGERCTT